jgi:nucleotide-binding universal stress UspA family protein
MTIIVGYVPKPEGRAALKRASEEARVRREDLVIVNFSSGEALADFSIVDVKELETLKQGLIQEGVSCEVLQDLAVGDVANEITEVAAMKRARMIVIGMRRRSPVGKFVLGSTAQRVLLQAPCDVLAVKA